MTGFTFIAKLALSTEFLVFRFKLHDSNWVLCFTVPKLSCKIAPGFVRLISILTRKLKGEDRLLLL